MSRTLKRLPQNADFVLRGGDESAVHARQWFEFPGRKDGRVECWCYTDRLSYRAGDSIRLFAISTTAYVDIRVVSESGSGVCMTRFTKVKTRWQDCDYDVSVTGCNWPVIKEITVPDDWPSGAYRILLFPHADSDNALQAQHLFIIRPGNPPKSKRLLLVTADATWNAYNDWGGSNHYEGTIDPLSNRFSPRLSNQRPYAHGFISLPADAPRTLPRHRPGYSDPPGYPHMQWAWDNGFSKKYASAGWASYEKHFVNWALQNGYPLDIATQQDLHFRPDTLEGYACVVMVGHDEYWSWEMRDTMDDYIEQGGHVARFAGNFLWQIRLRQHGEIQVCHKYLARREDEYINGTQKHLTTTCWEAAEIGRPGHATFGLDASRGMYAGWGGMAPRGSGGFTLYRPEHWAFENSRLGYGDILGSQAPVFGYEVDGLDYRIESGLPYPLARDSLPEDLQILAVGLARMREDDFSGSKQSLFVGDDDARFMAELIYDDVNPSTLARVDRGCGMIVSFSRGRGSVFHAGCTEWIAGLIYADKAVEQVTQNVLNKFLG